MNLQVVTNDIMTLPADKQQEVIDFIAFLKIRLGIHEKKTLAERNVSRMPPVF